MPLPQTIGSGKALLGGRRPVTYLWRPMRAPADQAAPLPSPYSEPGGVGSMTLVQTDGQMSASGGSMLIPAQASAVWGDLGGYASASFARTAGRALVARLRVTTANATGLVLGWSRTQVAQYSGIDGRGLYLKSSVLDSLDDAAAATGTLGAFSTATDYDVMSVLRAAGNDLFVKGGAFTAWTRLYHEASDSGTPLYPAFGNMLAVLSMADPRVIDLGGVWATTYADALNASTFTAANGTSLDAITPEVGGAWTERNGDWDVQSNRANATGAAPGGAQWVATVESGLANVLVETIVSMAAGGAAGLILRYTDNLNFWLLQPQDTANGLDLFECNAGVFTQRATAAIAVLPATDYRLVAICDGTTITGYLNDGSRITYASATLNQTATKHGIRSLAAAARFDDFQIHPRYPTLPSV